MGVSVLQRHLQVLKAVLGLQSWQCWGLSLDSIKSLKLGESSTMETKELGLRVNLQFESS